MLFAISRTASAAGGRLLHVDERAAEDVERLLGPLDAAAHVEEPPALRPRHALGRQAAEGREERDHLVEQGHRSPAGPFDRPPEEGGRMELVDDAAAVDGHAIADARHRCGGRIEV